MHSQDLGARYRKVMAILFILTAVLFCSITFSNQQTCDQKGLEKFDEDFSIANSIGNPHMRLPESNDQIKTWCKKVNDHLADVEEYNKKCSRDLFKHLNSLYIYGFKRTTRLYCKTGSKPAKSLIDSAPCYNRNKKVEINCYNQFLDGILGTENERDDKKKIPYLCCLSNQFYECLDEKLINLPVCNEKKMDSIRKFQESQTTDALNYFCADYRPDNDKCNKLGEPPKRNKSQKRNKSPMISTARIFESIKD